MQSPNILYSPKLDHLRFFAAFVVLMFHSNLWYIGRGEQRDSLHIPIFDQGYTGVALFMVISGFILTLITYGKEMNARRFYLNRILRIYPLFAFVVTFGYFSTPDPRETSVGIDYLMALLPISNLYRLKYGAYGGVLFSVAIELQFYLLFPITAIMVRDRGVRFLLALVGFMLLLRAIVFMLNGSVHHLAYFSIFGGLDLFLIGCLAAVFYARGPERKISVWWSVGVLLLINLVIWLVHRPGGLFHVDYSGGGRVASNSPLWVIWPALQGVMFSGLLLAYLASRTKLPFSRSTAYLGRISYSLYAWHIIICMLVAATMRPLLGSPYLTGIAIILPLSIGLAAVSYALIESPFLRMRVPYARAAAENTPVS